jgi:hypothetical protein
MNAMTSNAAKRCVRGLMLGLTFVGFSAFAATDGGSPSPAGQVAAAGNAEASGGSVAYLQHLVDTHQLTEMRTTYNGTYGASELFQPEKLTYFVALFHDKVFWRVISTDSMKNADSIYRTFVAQTEQLAQVDIDALRLQAGNKYAEHMMALNQQRLQNLQQDAAQQQQESQQVAVQLQQAQQQAVSLSKDLSTTSTQLDSVKQQIHALEAQQNNPDLALPPAPSASAPASTGAPASSAPASSGSSP